MIRIFLSGWERNVDGENIPGSVQYRQSWKPVKMVKMQYGATF